MSKSQPAGAQESNHQPRYSWNAPVCERCWISKNTDIDPEGNISIRKPVLLLDYGPETCAYCGSITIFGCFVRDNPDNLKYPKLKEED